MSTMLPQSPPEPSEPQLDHHRHHGEMTPERQRYRQRDRRIIVGIVLLLFGVLMLVETLTNWALLGMLIVPALGLGLTLWGCVSRRSGLVIPGGILLGVGTGALLVQQGVAQPNGTDQGAVVVLCLALGFAIITPLTWAFTERMHWWPLIPAAVLALVGVGMVAGEWGAVLLEWLGRLWPVVLVIVGAIILWDVARNREKR